jgi:hypothetical protein
MSEPSGAHQSIRNEWVETPPDVSYRFVVNLATLRAADAVARAVRRTKKRWWQRGLGFLMQDLVRFVVGGVIMVFFGWIAVQAALVVMDTTEQFGVRAVLPTVIFLIVFLGLLAGFRYAVRRWASLSLQRFHREFFADNEFLLEGRPSHLWFDEQSSGALRRWSTFEQPVEFQGGMWLFLRRRTTFAGLRGILISRDSLPNSCTWSELQTYLRRRIEEGAKHHAYGPNHDSEQSRSDTR